VLERRCRRRSMSQGRGQFGAFACPVLLLSGRACTVGKIIPSSGLAINEAGEGSRRTTKCESRRSDILCHTSDGGHGAKCAFVYQI
jgi:hypothetical protein